MKIVNFLYFIFKVWDRRTLCESQPKPVGILVGHEDGITYVDSKVNINSLIRLYLLNYIKKQNFLIV